MTNIIDMVKRSLEDFSMAQSQEEKRRSHARIVASAARIIRERGLETPSVADVMKDAGLTHGGFYRHFESKDALVEAALAAACDQVMASFTGGEGAETTGDAERTVFPGFRRIMQAHQRAGTMPEVGEIYLSPEHVGDSASGCAFASLGMEVGRASPSLKAVFGGALRRMLGFVASMRRGEEAARRTAAIREFSMLVGALVLARASDPELSDEILTACRER